jgi:dienelactone hydrolase
MRRWLAIIILLLPVAARAAPPFPVLDVAAVPHLNEQGRRLYADFLLANVPRVFVVASNGHSGWASGGDIEQARVRALKSCADKGGADCAIYAEDLQVVWQGKSPIVLPPVPPPLAQNGDFALAPDARFFWFGPQAARGVFVWGHGKGNVEDGRNAQPQSYVRAFNNAGFDVVRFARAPSADYVDRAADWLRASLPLLRQQGWHTVIVGGQSRGAWNALQMLDTPGLADAVIAVSPASFVNQFAQESDLHRILSGDKSPKARVAVAQFTGDKYVPNMKDRLEMERELLPSRSAAVLVIGEPGGITEHGGGNTSVFAQRYGPCLLHFVIDPMPPRECEER